MANVYIKTFTLLVYNRDRKRRVKEATATHHAKLLDHRCYPAEVNLFIQHCYKHSVRVCVSPVERRSLRITHSDASSIPDVGAELSQRTAVQPDENERGEADVCTDTTTNQNQKCNPILYYDLSACLGLI